MASHSIDSYDFGEIVIDGKRHTHDVIIYPDRVVEGWHRREGHLLQAVDVEEIPSEKPEALIVGTGYAGMLKIDSAVERILKSKGIELISSPTDRACEIYGQVSKTRRIVAVLHLTC